MCGRRYQGRLYYRCVGDVVHRLSKQRVCHSQSLRGERLEAALWADVSGLLAEPRRIEEAYQRRLNIDNAAKEPSSEHKLQMQISRVQRQVSKLIDA
jgi:site-specific DNA recombinase